MVWEPIANRHTDRQTDRLTEFYNIKFLVSHLDNVSRKTLFSVLSNMIYFAPQVVIFRREKIHFVLYFGKR